MGVLRNYARFYSWKFLEYWLEKDAFKRRYLLGCLWAFVKTTVNKRFYNLKRVKQKGLHTEIEFGFDESKILSREQMAQFKQNSAVDVDFIGTISACGIGNDLAEAESYGVTHGLSVQRQTDVIQVALIEDDEPTRINLRVNLRAQKGIEVAAVFLILGL